MNEAYLYDALRTPRGKGKKDGSLNEVAPIKLASQTLKALEKRNNISRRTRSRHCKNSRIRS